MVYCFNVVPVAILGLSLTVWSSYISLYILLWNVCAPVSLAQNKAVPCRLRCSRTDVWLQIFLPEATPPESAQQLKMQQNQGGWRCRKRRRRRQLALSASWCIHNQNMLFWDPHGRFLLAYILNNQLLSGAPRGSSAGPQRRTQGTLGPPGWRDEGAVWLLRLSVRRFVAMLGAQSGDSVRAIPLTVMWLSRQPWPAPFFTHHPSLFPLHLHPLLLTQQLPEIERSLKTALVIIPKHILVIYARLPGNLRQFIILFPIFLFLICWCLVPLDFNL